MRSELTIKMFRHWSQHGYPDSGTKDKTINKDYYSWLRYEYGENIPAQALKVNPATAVNTKMDIEIDSDAIFA